LSSEWRRACEAVGLVAGRKALAGWCSTTSDTPAWRTWPPAGVPDSRARAISGHKTDSAHKRYVITQAAAKAAALAAMTERW